MSTHRLGDILVESGRITAEQLAEAIHAPGRADHPLGEALRDLGYVTDEDIARALAVQLEIPFQELGEEFRLEKEEVKLIPEPVARRFCVVALQRDHESGLTLVMKDPLDLHALDTIRSLTALDIHKAVSTEARIKAVINRSYTEEAHIERNLRELVSAEADQVVTSMDDSAVQDDQLRLLANDAPVVRFVNLLLLQAVRDRASDIHFEPHEKEIAVRLRVDGVLQEVTPPPKALYAGVVTRIKILSTMDIAERRLPQDGRFKFTVHGRIMDVRVSSLPVVNGEKLVLRLLDREALLVDMKDVGFEPDMLANFQRILREPHGIILLTGPTGSGKTSTLYSALSFLRSPEVNIQTVEDPVEYQLPGINQMAVKALIGLDFANALRSILRQDPDIIMIGEMRDGETAQIAVQSSLTGHLVLSTLHTNTAASAVVRMQDMGVERYLITSTVNGVLAQRLVRRLCPHCKTPVQPDPALLQSSGLGRFLSGGAPVYEARGCDHCRGTGYQGRTAIHELLVVDEAMRSAILQGLDASALQSIAVKAGMYTLYDDGLRKVAAGVTSLDEVLLATQDQGE